MTSHDDPAPEDRRAGQGQGTDPVWPHGRRERGTHHRAVDAPLDLPVEAGLELEADLIARCFASEDGQRELRGFVDKGPRKASFLGR